MIMPLISFYQNLTLKEFSQATDSQLEKIRFWFFASIIESRYGGGRQGSTNVILKEDCEMMRDLAKGNPPHKTYWQQFRFNF